MRLWGKPSIGDRRSRRVARELMQSVHEIDRPWRSHVEEKYSNGAFISHSSANDAYITGAHNGSRIHEPGSIRWIVAEYFPDPFYHSVTTGGASEYVRLVGAALQCCKHILVVWSRNALRSFVGRFSWLPLATRK
jgi:hypothetical protein